MNHETIKPRQHKKERDISVNLERVYKSRFKQTIKGLPEYQTLQSTTIGSSRIDCENALIMQKYPKKFLFQSCFRIKRSSRRISLAAQCKSGNKTSRTMAKTSILSND